MNLQIQSSISIVSSISVILLSGCAAGLPAMIDEQFLPLEAVVKKMNCELEIATFNESQRNKEFRDWQLSYTITLKANEIGGFGSSSNTFPIVISPATLANIGVGGSYTQTANRTAIFKFDAEVSKLSARNACVNFGLHPFVAGEIGFGEWLNKAANAATDYGANSAGMKRLSSVSHTFEFSVQTTASASAGFLITPGKRTTALNPGISGERFDDHIVEIVFAKPVPAAPPTVVTVVVPVLSEQQKEEIAEIKREQENKRRLMVDLDSQRLNLEKNFNNFSANDTSIVANIKEKAASAKILDAEVINGNAKINEIRRSPAGKETAQRVIPSPPSSPLTNPNLTSSLLQLQLERLNTTLNRGVGRF